MHIARTVRKAVRTPGGPDSETVQCAQRSCWKVQEQGPGFVMCNAGCSSWTTRSMYRKALCACCQCSMWCIAQCVGANAAAGCCSNVTVLYFYLTLLAGVFPDMHMACNTTCKLDWTREWIRAHLRDALRMNKPAILGGIGALRPQSWRLQVLQVVHEEIERALKYGHPIGGKWGAYYVT